MLGASDSLNRTDRPAVPELSVYWDKEEEGLCIAHVIIAMITLVIEDAHVTTVVRHNSKDKYWDLAE